MKKIMTLALAAVMAFALCACGSKPAPAQTTAAPAETTAAQAETTTAEETTEAKAELPEIKGRSHDIDYELTGINFTKSYDDEPAIRLWFNVVNNSDGIESPSYISAWDGIIVTQGEEELNGCATNDDILAETLNNYNFIPGVALQYAEVYKMVNDQDVVKVEIVNETDDGEEVLTFEVDPKTFEDVIPAPVEWEKIEDTSWFEPESDEIFDDFTGINVKIIDAEVMDGTDWMRKKETKVIRIVFDAENTSDKERYVSGTFVPYQDGVSLALGLPKEENDEDIRINVKFQPGEHRQIAKTFVLYNETSPIVFYAEDAGTQYGRVFEAK